MTYEQQPGVPDDTRERRVREAEEAHGGSMAPAVVDETGRPVAEPPPAPAGDEDGTGS
ncbi:hypothetical protein [Micromonospora sp. KC723]|uniref:hypothetical protein n=1 Tax=Micromonospora sp. KC723 TaxID=2530381 RepID=UPI0014047463|nr:hypothetical protein [Micromonospora sp. KC723]